MSNCNICCKANADYRPMRRQHLCIDCAQLIPAKVSSDIFAEYYDEIVNPSVVKELYHLYLTSELELPEFLRETKLPAFNEYVEW